MLQSTLLRQRQRVGATEHTATRQSYRASTSTGPRAVRSMRCFACRFALMLTRQQELAHKTRYITHATHMHAFVCVLMYVTFIGLAVISLTIGIRTCICICRRTCNCNITEGPFFCGIDVGLDTGRSMLQRNGLSAIKYEISRNQTASKNKRVSRIKYHP